MATSAAANYASLNNVDYLANINQWIDTNRNATPEQVNQQMSQYGITEADIVKALIQRTDLPVGSTLKLGDTFYQPNFRITGSGEDQQIGPLENILAYKENENKAGGKYNQYLPSGEVERTGTQQKVDNSMLPFLLAAGGLMFGVPDLSAAIGGGGTAGTVAGLSASELAVADMALGGLGGSAGATALAESALLGGAGAGGLLTGGAGTIGTTGLTAAELALQDISLGGLGGTAGAETLASALTTGATVPTITSLTGGSGLITGAGGASLADLALQDLSLGGAGGTAGAESLATALTTGADTATLSNLTGGSGLLTSDLVTADTVAKKLAADSATQAIVSKLGTTLPPGWEGLSAQDKISWLNANNITAEQLVNAGIPQADVSWMSQNGLGGAALTAATTAATTGVTGATTLTDLLTKAGTGLLGNLTGQQLSNLLSGGLGTAGNLLQMQQSREATQAAQARVDAETAAAKQAAQFRPVGMTTRFGSSEFKYDPVTGQMVSAGYQLTPEAKAQQDRLVALSNRGLSQAEQAQAQFAPLQQGAQSLFGLGNQYLAQSPEEVAQRYISQQMNLLAPSRETELANLQNRLYQQGRSGLAVSQGGNLGATTPELQALYNARAQQDAQLAAQAQQAGQQQVAFGAGLLGTGAQTMGQYYGGQQAAYAPYTAAMGQVQNLESQAQQAYNMSQALAQQQAQAGANAGRLGLTGAQLSTNLATSADATRNLGAQSLIAAGNPNAMFGQSLGNVFGGLLSGGVAPITAMSAPSTGFGAGNYYGNQDVLGTWSS
jgi:hypothetical protein